MGSYMEHITANDPAAKDRLMKGLDGSSTVTATYSTCHQSPSPLRRTDLMEFDEDRVVDNVVAKWGDPVFVTGAKDEIQVPL